MIDAGSEGQDAAPQSRLADAGAPTPFAQIAAKTNGPHAVRAILNHDNFPLNAMSKLEMSVHTDVGRDRRSRVSGDIVVGIGRSSRRRRCRVEVRTC